MAILRQTFTFLFLAQFIIGSHSLPEDIILSAHIQCGDTINDTAFVYVLSDVRLSAAIRCDGNQTYDVNQVAKTEYYNRTVYYSGDPASECVFIKKMNPEIYRVYLEVAYDMGLEHILESYVLSCTNDLHKAGVLSSVKEISRSLFPRKQFETHLGHTASSTFSMEVQDIYGHTLNGVIALRKKIRLAVTMSGTPTEQGFKVVHCDALGSDSIKYSFLRSGCGDGFVIDYEKGFITTGLMAHSPYFWSFRLYGSNTVSFQCTFNTCSDSCDGDSCGRKRLKRGEDFSDEKAHDFSNAKHKFVSSVFNVIRPDVQNKKIHLVESDLLTIDDEKPSSESIPQRTNEKEQTTGRRLVSAPDKQDSPETTQNSNREDLENTDTSKKSHTENIKHLTDSENSRKSVKKSTSATSAHSGKNLKLKSIGMTYEQIGVIVGCSSFLLMIGLFLCVSLWHIRQKNNVESKYKALRVNNLGSTTYLLADMDD